MSEFGNQFEMGMCLCIHKLKGLRDYVNNVVHVHMDTFNI